MNTTMNNNESKSVSGSRAVFRSIACLAALLSLPALGGCISFETSEEESVGAAMGELGTEVCNGIDDDFDFLVDEGNLCQFGARERTAGHEYLLADYAIAWDKAREVCRGRGFDFVIIGDAAENTWLSAFTAADQKNRWIGLYSPNINLGYRWVDGSIPVYTHWMPWDIAMPGTGKAYMNAIGFWWVNNSNIGMPSFCELMDPVSWTNTAGVTVNGTWLTKTSGNGWNAGASSLQSITEGDGFVQFTTGEINKSKAAGLAVGDSNQSLADIDYSIRLDGNGNIYVDELGVNKGTFGTYAADDVFRVEVLDGKVRYKRNEVVFYTSSTPASYPLLLDTSLYHTGATLGDARLKACTGKDSCIQRGYWDNAVAAFAGTNSEQGNFLKRGPGNGWTAGAVSFDQISSGDGYMEFQTMETNLSKVAGLSVGDAGQHYNEIDFAIRLDGNGNIYVDENGLNKGVFGPYTVNDVFRVEVLNGRVRYMKNGVIFHSSTALAAYPLHIDTSLYHAGSTIVNASLQACSGCIEPGVWNNVFSTFAGSNANDGHYLTRGPGNSWSAGASSFDTIDVGSDGYVEFKTNEINKSKALGLSVSDDNQSYNDIDYSIRLDANGNVYVDELGANKGVFGPYTINDVFRVEVLDGLVRYTKNGVVFHSSEVPVTSALRLDTSLYHEGATIRHASIVSCPDSSCITPGAWANVFGVFAGSNATDGNYLRRAPGNAWSAGAVSFQTINSGNGYVEFTTNELAKSKAAGLGSGDSNQHLNDIEYAIRLDANNNVYIDESGVNKGVFGAYQIGDVFRVELVNGWVRYYRNGTELRAVAVSPVYPLRLDTSLYHENATITHAEIGAL